MADRLLAAGYWGATVGVEFGEWGACALVAETYLDPADHQDKDIRAALQRIMASGGWRLIKAGHWGHLRCDEGCCDIPVNGTPKVPSRDARDLERKAQRCPLDVDDPRTKRR